jgi:hypothetical protein
VFFSRSSLFKDIHTIDLDATMGPESGALEGPGDANIPDGYWDVVWVLMVV